MKRSPATRMVEDYVTLIWKAHEWPGGEPSTTDLAAQLGVTPSTVSANLKRLARDGLISYEPYGPIELTDDGRAIAIDIVRRHRIVETYLVEHLELSWDQVHDEANHRSTPFPTSYWTAWTPHSGTPPTTPTEPRSPTLTDGSRPITAKLSTRPNPAPPCKCCASRIARPTSSATSPDTESRSVPDLPSPTSAPRLRPSGSPSTTLRSTSASRPPLQYASAPEQTQKHTPLVPPRFRQ